MLLDGQVAIVTGAGRGLGRAVALALAAQGASVVVASRNAPELDLVVRKIRLAGGRALAQTADVADDRQVRELVLATERWVGPATIVVNCANTVEPVGPLARSEPAAWLRGLAVNVGGAYLVVRAVLPGMLDRGRGRIINISSSVAQQPVAGWTAFGASKAAVEQLTRALAFELEGTGVGVCAFAPGALDAGGRPRDLEAAATTITYLALPASSPNGCVLVMGDVDLARAVAAALA